MVFILKKQFSIFYLKKIKEKSLNKMDFNIFSDF